MREFKSLRSVCSAQLDTTRKCRDIDVLLICETPVGSELYDYNGEMEQIARLMAGIHSDRSVLDPCLVELVKTTGAILANAIEAPIDFAFGPSPREEFLTQSTIHLNGPVTERMWAAFGKRFPIHVVSICNTFQCFLGNEPARPSKIEHVHVREMATLLEQRILRVSPNERLARKLLQALGTLSGARTCHVQDLVEAIFATRHQTRLALEDFSLKSVPVEELCKSLLANSTCVLTQCRVCRKLITLKSQNAESPDHNHGTSLCRKNGTGESVGEEAQRANRLH